MSVYHLQIFISLLIRLGGIFSGFGKGIDICVKTLHEKELTKISEWIALTGKIDVLISYQNSIAVGTISERLESNIVEKSVKYAVEFAEKYLKILHEREAAEAHLGPQALITFNKVAEQLKGLDSLSG